ncbi:aminotransferase class V-fold PLP-dependent enzyme [Peptoniphilus harei]|uniref:aminotransferase class V-fold PLP-dependent enzyme n=1 Tax=Peptoniphilus harei TaxID=54005 RepID=UPI00254C57F1|nr:aminotransferase class V-fold PLP-dependent enzyme [Peptoniphilus harei]MDK7354445.1 aminotransferase class V-fold PLP-dependent enzyme [Peptoniphilus harei]MDK7369926.1 aminotransferase class V-fold PLP-dependent enzyme [Peptoniphilus harei]
MIYLDNASTTLIKPESVGIAVMEGINSRNFANPNRGSYEMSLNSLRALYDLREDLGELFGVKALKVSLCANVTTALNLVLNSLLHEKDHIITSRAEHNSVLRPLNHLKLKGVEVSYLPLIGNKIDLSYLNKLLQKNTKVVCLTAMSNVSGQITNLKAAADFCKKHGLILIIDGAQAAGSMDLNLKDFDRTVLCFTGHKSLYGPEGTGGIALKGDIKFEEVFSGGGGNSNDEHQSPFMPDIFEYGTINVHSNLGLLAGVKYVKSLGIDKISKDLFELSSYLYKSLKSLEGIRLYGDHGYPHGPIVSFNYKDYASEEVADLLWQKGEIATRAKLHCAPLFHKAMGTDKRGMVRVSLSTFNSFEDVDKLIETLKNIA